MKVKLYKSLFILFYISLSIIPSAFTQERELSASELKKLSLEELMNLRVTLVTRTPQKLTQSASAIQVVTGEDIRNSGATNIAEALRLVSNLQVSQMSSNAWIIGARGFNTLFANKLLVMIDGRTVYTPLFAGVLWDVQNVLLEDVERIEVISGPGATLWGANAVNGVINIITKNSAETQGLYVSALGGSFMKDEFAARWGGKIGEKMSYKVYGQHFDRKSSLAPDGTSAADDAWKNTQGGFKMNWAGKKSNTFTVQGDYYGGAIGYTGGNSDFNGQNLLGRWRQRFSENSDMTLQAYYDRYYREDAPNGNSDEINTFDIDFQHRVAVAKRHTILWGLGYRRVKDKFVSNGNNVAILPETKNLDLVNSFIQDEISVSSSFKLTLGTKISHNVYTGIEVQPSIRGHVTVKDRDLLWAAISRAVRTPSRVDADYFSPPEAQPPTVFSVAGGPDVVSEKVYAYEAGYRMQPNNKSTFSLATFYNVYNDIYSLEPVPGTLTYQIQNGTKGTSWGAELSGTYQVLNNWRLRGGYTYFDKKLEAKPGHTFDPSYLANDVQNQFMLQSMANFSSFDFDVAARYLDYIPASLATQKVPAYFTFDARLAYTYKRVEFSVVGQNLASKRHTEFNTRPIPRSVYGKVALRL